MRAFRLLLRLYPASFRAEYGAEMCGVFAARRREAAGPAAAAALWVETLADVAANAPRVHAELLRQDLRWTARSLRSARGFALTAIAVTGLGVGANTAVFSVADRVLLRPLPYPEPDRLVKLWESPPGYSRTELSPANWRDWRSLATSFEAAAAFTRVDANLGGAGAPRRVEGAAVTADLVSVLGVRPWLGRLPAAADDREDAPGVLVLSHGAWLEEFGGDVDVLGRRVRLDDLEYEIVGVLPPGARFPSPSTRFWRTFRFGPADFEDRADRYLQAVARLRPGVSIEEARAEMAVIAARLEREHPDTNARSGASVIRLRDEIPGQTRVLLAALLGASGCVLLIACSNLAGLLLARALGRRKELAVRAALGAGRERLVRQLLTESLVLAAGGGILGALLAAAAAPLLSSLTPHGLPLEDSSAIDLRVLAFAAAVTLATGLGFGVLPAIRAAGGRMELDVREGGRSGLGGRREGLRGALVAAEVTVAVVLLVCGGLLLRALARVEAVDPGFRGEGVLAVETPLPWGRYGLVDRRADLYGRVLAEVRALPGVTRAAYASFVPMAMKGGIWAIEEVGAPAGPGEAPRASLRFVTPGFFATLGIPLRAGRDVAASDTREAPYAAVVSESFARTIWPGRDPIGRRFRIAFDERTVVGVAADVRARGLERDAEPQVWLPHGQVADSSLMWYAPKELVVRTSGDPEALVPAVRAILARVDPELPLGQVRTLDDVVGAETAPRRTQVRVLAVFAALALLLAGVGIHGLLSFAVSQRSAEIGVRMALGARAADVLRLVVGRGVALAVLGALAGSA
ncbi:MAG TPA: ABC transporter permease, partial [Gemmatimonadota bacterium]